MEDLTWLKALQLHELDVVLDYGGFVVHVDSTPMLLHFFLVHNIFIGLTYYGYQEV